MTPAQTVDDIRAGLEAVTPGEWEASSNSVSDFGSEYPCSLSFEFIYNPKEDDEREDYDRAARIASHFARCSPSSTSSTVCGSASRNWKETCA